ncbi:beta-galactosidase-1-like protein 2 [Mizuhopecten yessoensis]|uniref:Beta-galactosidase n=1 Tax=Mizuhopecten yessoensis TaxID=6573 RepID=A0A210QLL2_MIZYE|nr:beta-galactosidase-1-like protein 2 [Mizuhopecten yessoensis]OWF49561.1 Beta-galactosidase-1-like protein 2 [Mizuhopecten yessoensis]
MDWHFVLFVLSSIFCVQCEVNIPGVPNRRFLVPTEYPKATQAPNGLPYVSNASLSFRKRQFYLDGKPFQLLGGSIHYFRVLPEYWRDRLMKLKACGLNTVTIYVSWNLHEVYPGEFDFSGRLNLRQFIQLAHELGLYVSLRPGPYICAEWEFGGLPGWLLKDPHMVVRSNYPGYTRAVERFFTRLLQEVVDLQFSRGGPIIAIQVENEFGSYSDEVTHLAFLKQLLQKNGIVEMFFTSDGYVAYNMTGLDRAPFYKDALPTANFNDIHQGYGLFLMILRMSENFPLMVTEFWAGWFDYWGRGHNTVSVDVFSNTLKSILAVGASVNLYMFHGGTNFGFTNGANMEKDGYHSDVTSYDYDALVSEDGQLTPKYFAARNLIRTMSLSAQDNASLPDPPSTNRDGFLGPVKIQIQSYIALRELIGFVETPITSTSPVCMEDLVWKDNGYGQNFGYIYYTSRISHGGNLTFTGAPTDRNEIFVDDVTLAIHDVHDTNVTLHIPASSSNRQEMELGILVENRGRVNYALFSYNFLNEQRKGINSDILLDDQVIRHWKIYPMDFSDAFINRTLADGTWTTLGDINRSSPTLYRGRFDISSNKADTFLWMTDWCKGFVLINGFNLGRYWNVGPLMTLYVPGTLLKEGQNEILIFDQHCSHTSVQLRKTPVLSKDSL